MISTVSIHLLFVAVAAQVRPDVNGFAMAPGHGRGTVASVWSSGGAEVSWQGRCLAWVPEALPPAAGALPPGQCLEDAIIRETDLPNRPEDDRAEEIYRAPALLARWRACYRSGPAEACLDRMLPIPTESIKAGPPLTARCRLTGIERENGVLNFRCEGTLVEAECNSMANVVFSTDGEGGYKTDCAEDKRSLAVVVELGPPPTSACIATARAALRSARARFPAARAAALGSCGVWDSTQAGSPGAYEAEDDGSLPSASRELARRVLARQQALFGPLRLPLRCDETDRACVESGDGRPARLVGSGCGASIWIWQPDGGAAYGDGHWSTHDDRSLVRLAAQDRVAIPPEAEEILIGESYRAGDYFGGPQGMIPKTEADLIYETCAARKGDEGYCLAYASGGRPSDMIVDRSRAARARAKAIINADWPRAARRLARWQVDLARGSRLDPVNGEDENWSCTPLLADPCTGDLGEICTGLSTVETGCDGQVLADGRCRRYHFARLPLYSPPPAGVHGTPSAK